jgi:hypothetical protein
MRPQDIKIGEYYRHRNAPNYYVKVLGILKPKQGVNTKAYTIVRCEFSMHKIDNTGLIKHFRPCDLVREEKK